MKQRWIKFTFRWASRIFYESVIHVKQTKRQKGQTTRPHVIPELPNQRQIRVPGQNPSPLTDDGSWKTGNVLLLNRNAGTERRRIQYLQEKAN